MAIVRALGLLAGYAGAVVWLTWPLAASLGSALPATGPGCKFDLLFTTAVLAHESRALVTASGHLADLGIYYPTANSLFYGQASFGALPLFAPLFLATGNPTLAINVTFLLGITLTAIAMHVVVRRWTGSDLAGVVGAATLLGSYWLLWGVPAAPQYASLEVLPLIAFAAAAPVPSAASTLALVTLVVLQCLTDPVYIAPAVLGPLAVLTVVRLVRRRTRPAGLALAATLVLVPIILAPVLRGYLAVQAANPDLATQTKWVISEASIPLPIPQHLFGGPAPFVVTPVAVGLVALGALAALARRRHGAGPPLPGGWAHGALWAGVGFFLSLPKFLWIAGQGYRSPLGYVDMVIPIFQTIRAPTRLGVAGFTGLGILSGVAFGEIVAWIRSRLRRPGPASVVCAILTVAVVGLLYRAYRENYFGWSVPGPLPTSYPLQPAPAVPATFQTALQSTRAPVLELPLGRNGLGEKEHALAMYHAITDGHPLLNGYSSYWPTGFPERMAEASRLPDQQALAHLVTTTGLTYVWVHTKRLPRSELDAWAKPPHARGLPGLWLAASAGPEELFVVMPTPPLVDRLAGR